MTDAFGGAADFSGITGTKKLHVSKVIQKTFIRFNEKGSEAAAATGTSLVFKSKGRTQDFIVDHPFHFMLKDKKTGILLFQGRVDIPKI